MTWHPDESSLHDFLEEDLPREEEERVRSHLAECSRCRDEAQGLSDLLMGLGELPQEAQPSRDLWPQIAWRVGESAAVARKEESSGARRAGLRVTLPAWQLLAASLAVALLSGGTVWAVLSGTAVSRVGPASVAMVPATSAQPAGLPPALTAYEEAVTELEAVLELGREVLDEETVHVLEANLRIIDRAIRDAQEALTLDPASGVLQRVLAGNLRRKVDLLRQAAQAVYANS